MCSVEWSVSCLHTIIIHSSHYLLTECIRCVNSMTTDNGRIISRSKLCKFCLLLWCRALDQVGPTG